MIIIIVVTTTTTTRIITIVIIVIVIYDRSSLRRELCHRWKFLAGKADGANHYTTRAPWLIAASRHHPSSAVLLGPSCVCWGNKGEITYTVCNNDDDNNDNNNNNNNTISKAERRLCSVWSLPKGSKSLLL